MFWKFWLNKHIYIHLILKLIYVFWNVYMFQYIFHNMWGWCTVPLPPLWCRGCVWYCLSLRPVVWWGGGGAGCVLREGVQCSVCMTIYGVVGTVSMVCNYLMYGVFNMYGMFGIYGWYGTYSIFRMYGVFGTYGRYAMYGMYGWYCMDGRCGM